MLLVTAVLAAAWIFAPAEVLRPDDIAFALNGRIVAVHEDEFGAVEALTFITADGETVIGIAAARVITLNGKFSKHNLRTDMKVYVSLREEANADAELVLVDKNDYQDRKSTRLNSSHT